MFWRQNLQKPRVWNTPGVQNDDPSRTAPKCNPQDSIVRIITQHRAQAGLCSESWLTGSQAGTCNCFPLSFLQLCLWGLRVDTVLHGLLRPLHGRAFVIHLQLAGVLLMLQGHKQQWTPLPHQHITRRLYCSCVLPQKACTPEQKLQHSGNTPFGSH